MLTRRSPYHGLLLFFVSGSRMAAHQQRGVQGAVATDIADLLSQLLL